MRQSNEPIVEGDTFVIDGVAFEVIAVGDGGHCGHYALESVADLDSAVITRSEAELRALRTEAEAKALLKRILDAQEKAALAWEDGKKIANEPNWGKCDVRAKQLRCHSLMTKLGRAMAFRSFSEQRVVVLSDVGDIDLGAFTSLVQRSLRLSRRRVAQALEECMAAILELDATEVPEQGE